MTVKILNNHLEYIAHKRSKPNFRFRPPFVRGAPSKLGDLPTLKRLISKFHSDSPYAFAGRHRAMRFRMHNLQVMPVRGGDLRFLLSLIVFERQPSDIGWSRVIRALSLKKRSSYLQDGPIDSNEILHAYRTR